MSSWHTAQGGAQAGNVVSGHKQEVLDLAGCAAVPGLIASLSKDGSARLWDAGSETCLLSHSTDSNCLVSILHCPSHQDNDQGIVDILGHASRTKNTWCCCMGSLLMAQEILVPCWPDIYLRRSASALPTSHAHTSLWGPESC